MKKYQSYRDRWALSSSGFLREYSFSCLNTQILLISEEGQRGREHPSLAYPPSRTQLGLLDPFAEQKEHSRISPYCQPRETLRAKLESWIHPDETSSPFGEKEDRKVPDKR